MAQGELLFSPDSLTVMIVDDHDPIRKAIRRVLTAMHFAEIVECHDGEDALKTLQRRPVDLIVLDLYMRGVSGFDLLENVRNRDIASDLPVIVVTGEASKEEIVKVADMGADDYVLKPFQTVDLEKKIINALNNFYSPTPVVRAIRKAERLYVTKDYNAALEAYSEVFHLDAMSARGAHGKALTLAKLNRVTEAIALLEENLRANHSYYKNYGAIADLYLSQNKLPPAIEAMARELEINPKQPNRQIQIAALLLKQGDALGAVDHYRVALQENSKLLGALMGMGHAYGAAENLDKALYYFKRVRRYHPTATKALEAALKAATAAKEPKKAELLLRDEKSSHPERTDTYILLAMFYVKQGREDDALTVADELLAREPENIHALRIRGSVLLRQKDYHGAIDALQQVATIAASPEILVTMADAFIALDKTDEALDALHRALKLNPEHATSMLRLAEVQQSLQQWYKATLLFRRAAQLGANKERCQSGSQTCTARATSRRKMPRVAS